MVRVTHSTHAVAWPAASLELPAAAGMGSSCSTPAPFRFHATCHSESEQTENRLPATGLEIKLDTVGRLESDGEQTKDVIRSRLETRHSFSLLLVSSAPLLPLRVAPPITG
jgi:hypothetical protein